MAQSMTGLVAAAVTANARAEEKPKAEGHEPPATDFDPRAKLKAISSRSKQLWTVVYVSADKTLETAERDVEASLEGGADAVVLEMGRAKNIATLEKAVAHVRKKYAQAKVGVNFLGDDETDPYGYINGFRIAQEYDLHIVWTDFCGVDLVKELPAISQQTIESARPANAFYVSGIHMKYGTMLDPKKSIEHSALQAMGWVEGIIITGPKTGVPTDPERAVRARRTLGSYPMGTASGVSVENFHTIRDHVDFCLVNSSISDENHRILVAKVKALRAVMV